MTAVVVPPILRDVATAYTVRQETDRKLTLELAAAIMKARRAMYSYQEIADVLDTSWQNVQQHVTRAEKLTRDAA